MKTKTLPSAGPLLIRLLDAQAVEAQAVAYPELSSCAEQVLDRARDIQGCLVWPVGAAAERVAGAVTLASKGEVETGTWNSEVDGRRVLVILVAGVSTLSLEAAVAQLRRRGALEVHGCGVTVDGAAELDALDSYTRLSIEPLGSALALLGDAA
jgi:hypothetical protein